MYSVLTKTFSGLETNGSSGPCRVSAFGFLPIVLQFTKNFTVLYYKKTNNSYFLFPCLFGSHLNQVNKISSKGISCKDMKPLNISFQMPPFQKVIARNWIAALALWDFFQGKSTMLPSAWGSSKDPLGEGRAGH